MIYLVIGASCSGKSSFVKKMFIKNNELAVYKDITWLTETEDTILFGKYTNNIERERCGIDTIAYQEQGQVVINQLDVCVNMNKNIVLEGVKVASAPLMEHILKNNYNCVIVYLWCSYETSLKRNIENGSIQKEKSLKGAYTRCDNFYKKYKDSVPTLMINTDYITDFVNYDWSGLFEA